MTTASSNTHQHIMHHATILDGYSEIDAQMWSEFGNLICLSHLLGSTEVANLKII